MIRVRYYRVLYSQNVWYLAMPSYCSLVYNESLWIELWLFIRRHDVFIDITANLITCEVELCVATDVFADQNVLIKYFRPHIWAPLCYHIGAYA